MSPVCEAAEGSAAAGFFRRVQVQPEPAAGKMIQREDYRMDRPQRLPSGIVQVLKLYFTLQPGKADIRPQPDFRVFPGDPGIFLFFLSPGFRAFITSAYPSLSRVMPARP